MSLLGFDACGRMALGQLPVSRYLVLASVRGTYAVAGQGAFLNVSEKADSGPFLMVGGTVALASRLACSVRTYSLTGMAANLKGSLRASFGTYVVAGEDSSFTRDFEAWFPRPFDRDGWTASLAEPESWTSEAPPYGAWTARATQAEAWTPAVEQPETWTDK
jgi:hypothetical protein